ncbi:MAG: hypothetical protein GX627_01415 [Parcubacteria group bacterium]|jgi:hypothetical protein|nr:hypothetical protein [Parcubacteria group bacterium]
MEKTEISFPSGFAPLNTQVDIQVSKPLGLIAGVVVHEEARKLPLYNQPIKCDAKGQSKDGEEIVVNTVGRWLFGVPGYSGHIRIVPSQDKVSIYYPKESPGIVHELIKSLKEAVEVNL